MEKRQARRIRTLKRVHAAFNDEFCAVECVLKNISDTGALISFEDGILIPHIFKIVNRIDGYRVNCEIVRRVGNTAGIRFIGEFEVIGATRKQVVHAADIKKELDVSDISIVVDSSTTPEELTLSLKKKSAVAFGKRGNLKSAYK